MDARGSRAVVSTALDYLLCPRLGRGVTAVVPCRVVSSTESSDRHHSVASEQAANLASDHHEAEAAR